jgi:hypothetical protein
MIAVRAWLPALPAPAAVYAERVLIVFGPALAALVVTGVTEGRPGIRRWLARWTLRREHAWWWGLAPLGTLVLTVGTGR